MKLLAVALLSCAFCAPALGKKAFRAGKRVGAKAGTCNVIPVAKVAGATVTYENMSAKDGFKYAFEAMTLCNTAGCTKCKMAKASSKMTDDAGVCSDITGTGCPPPPATGTVECASDVCTISGVAMADIAAKMAVLKDDKGCVETSAAPEPAGTFLLTGNDCDEPLMRVNGNPRHDSGDDSGGDKLMRVNGNPRHDSGDATS